MRMLLMLHPRAGAHRQRAAILSQHACLVPDSRDFFRRVDSGGRHPKCPPHVFSDADVVAFRRSDDGPGSIVGTASRAEVVPSSR